MQKNINLKSHHNFTLLTLIY